MHETGSSSKGHMILSAAAPTSSPARKSFLTKKEDWGIRLEMECEYMGHSRPMSTEKHKEEEEEHDEAAAAAAVPEEEEGGKEEAKERWTTYKH